jgi:hypothetical protein
MVRGALIGTPVAFAVMVAALLGTGRWWQVVLVSLWPALVGGWFYGGLVALAPAMRRTERTLTGAHAHRRLIWVPRDSRGGRFDRRGTHDHCPGAGSGGPSAGRR